MCEDCGCQEANHHHHHDHDHDHSHNHGHHHHHDHPKTTKSIDIGTSVLAKNNAIAEKNREWFRQNNVATINLISSPGSGKTTLLEKTLENLNSKMNISVLVGDQQTDNDAVRMRKYGKKVKQINTVSGCHLDAAMIEKELGTFVEPSDDLLIIENVGNLVCPAAFDLGENKTIALLSTTEGEDKPIKYPTLFHKADIVVITKTDLIPHLDWEMDKCIAAVKQVQPKAEPILVSAKNDKGLEAWLNYLTTLPRGQES